MRKRVCGPRLRPSRDGNNAGSMLDLEGRRCALPDGDAAAIERQSAASASLPGRSKQRPTRRQPWKRSYVEIPARPTAQITYLPFRKARIGKIRKTLIRSVECQSIVGQRAAEVRHRTLPYGYGRAGARRLSPGRGWCRRPRRAVAEASSHPVTALHNLRVERSSDQSRSSRRQQRRGRARRSLAGAPPRCRLSGQLTRAADRRFRRPQA